MDHLRKQFGRAFSELVFEFPFERASKSHEDFGGSDSRNVDVEFVLVIPSWKDFNEPLVSLLRIMAKRV